MTLQLHQFYTPVSHQLSPAPWEGCLQIPEECESGWEKVELHHHDYQPTEPALKGRNPILAYFRGNDKTGYYVYPPWMRYHKPLEIPKAPAARQEKIPKTISRLIECMIRDDKRTNNSQCGERYIGAKCGDYTCIATDGRRALMLRNAKLPKSERSWRVCPMPKRTDPHVIFSDPDIMLAMMRIAVVTKDEKQSAVTLEWDHITGELLLKAKIADFEGVEHCKCQATFPGTITLDPHFVLEGMGYWPLMLFTYGETNPVSFAPMPGRKNQKPDFFYVVMPVKL